LGEFKELLKSVTHNKQIYKVEQKKKARKKDTLWSKMKKTVKSG